jgi:hypothetical protein
MRGIFVVGLLGLSFAACQLDTTPDDDAGDSLDDLVDGGDIIGDDSGDAADATDAPCEEDEPLRAELRNPENLTCDEFTVGSCTPGVPVPTWGVCESECQDLNEQACSTASACRVVKDAECLVQFDCLTDYLGCFPTDMDVDESIDCWTADAFQCSRSPKCSAAHSTSGGGGRPFDLCIIEGKSPGFCNLPVACDQAPPNCPQGTTPGVENRCYTGACIPEDLCPDF